MSLPHVLRWWFTVSDEGQIMTYNSGSALQVEAFQALEQRVFNLESRMGTLHKPEPENSEPKVGINLMSVHWYSGYHGGATFLPEPDSSWRYLASLGIELVRLPIKWERVQPELTNRLDDYYVGVIHKQLEFANFYQLPVVLDLHSGGYYNGTALGDGIDPGVYADVWERLSTEFGGKVHAYDLMNEPRVPFEVLRGAQNLAVDAIRDNGDNTTVWAEGPNLSLTRYYDDSYPAPWIADDSGDVVYSAHQYISGNGEYPEGYEIDNYSWSVDRSLEHLRRFTSWLENHGVKGSIGEVGWPSSKFAPGSWQAWNDEAAEFMDEALDADLDVTAFSARSCPGTTANDMLVSRGGNSDSADGPADFNSPGINYPRSQFPVIEQYLVGNDA